MTVNDEVLGLFLFQTFMPHLYEIGGFVTAFITIIILYVMHSWFIPEDK